MRFVGLITVLTAVSLCHGQVPSSEEAAKKVKKPRWQYGFEKRDKNKDGKLDKEELTGKSVWRYDADKDGFISQEEYKKMHWTRRKNRKKKGLRKRRVMSPKRWLKMRDKNGDGKLGKDEYKGKHDIFGKFDVDKDGFLTLEEIRKMPRFKKRWKANKHKWRKKHKKLEKTNSSEEADEATKQIK